jgi:hypothetical protein
MKGRGGAGGDAAVKEKMGFPKAEKSTKLTSFS